MKITITYNELFAYVQKYANINIRDHYNDYEYVRENASIYYDTNDVDYRHTSCISQYVDEMNNTTREYLMTCDFTFDDNQITCDISRFDEIDAYTNALYASYDDHDNDDYYDVYNCHNDDDVDYNSSYIDNILSLIKSYARDELKIA